MAEEILSIIVPSYNISKFVDECVPTYASEQLGGLLKVIFIDDGATDDTSDKLQKYLNLFPNLFIFYHKENGGHGSVINVGVHELIKTKYFKVIDGDDWVDTNELIKLCKYLQKSDSDVVLSNFTLVHGNNKKICQSRKQQKRYRDDWDGANITIHSATFKTSLFKNNKIFVREKVFYEDNEFILFPLEFAKSISYTNYNVYYYRLGNINQSVSLQSKIKHFHDGELVFDDLLNFYSRIYNTKLPEGKRQIIENVISSNIGFNTIINVFHKNKEARKYLLNLEKKVDKIPNLLSAVKKYRKYNRFLILTRYHFLSIFRNKTNG